MFKVNNKTPRQRHQCRLGAIIVYFEQISYLALMF